MAEANYTEQKCPQCGAPLQFDPASGNLLCEYCGYTLYIQAEPADEAQQEAPAFSSAAFEGKPGEYPIYNCRSCGAEIIAPRETAALTCPYCRNNIVLTDKVSGCLKPDGILPFKISHDQLAGVIHNFTKGKPFLPPRFFEAAEKGEITGIYVPFWVYDGEIGGEVSFNAHITRMHREGNFRVEDTAHFVLERSGDMVFSNIPADASEKMRDDYMDSLEPFPMQDVKPFDMKYLSGFTADRFDVTADEARTRAQRRMLNSALGILESQLTAGYSGVTVRHNGLRLRAENIHYYLLPVYYYSVTYKGTEYTYAINGATGKMVGRLPSDKSLKQAYWWKNFGIAAAAALVIQLLAQLF